MAKAAKKEKSKEPTEDRKEAEAEDGDLRADAKSEDGENAAEGDESGGKKKLSGKTIVLFIALPAVLVLALVIGGLFVFGVFGGEKKHEAEADAKTDAHAAVFFDLPELLVNLSAAEDGHENLLKISMAVELSGSDAVPKIEAAMPRIVDGAQVFLREMRLADLDGSAGMLKLREELLKRVNAAAAPVAVRDVLFKEIIVQ